ncbi:hypothetical protein BGW39_000892 [Mortierella sp. 14UC]|nr:hypothetical protein BGW39_000892 [Mortierella sp. 14UC]
MGFSAQSGSTNGSIAAAASTLISRTGYNTTTTTANNTSSGTRARDRRDSFQSSVAFSPTLSHSNPGVGGLTFQAGANSIYAHPPRFAHLWTGANTTADGSNGSNTGNRNRCLSTSSVDSNASSVGLSHLTPALAAMSVHHQASPANSPYQSYSSSPHHSSFQHQYQQQQHSSSISPYPPYHTAFSSSLQQTQVPAYDSLSVAASNIASSIYDSTPPLHSGSDIVYNSSSQYAQMSGATAAAASSAQPYNSPQRYGSAMLPLGPSLYSDQDSSRMAQPNQPFDSASPLAATRNGTARTFDYNDQYDASSHGQYYGQSQQGLGIMSTGGMARSSSPNHTGLDGGDLQSSSSDMMGLGSAKLGMKRNSSVGTSLQTPDDIHAVLGKDGKTLVYLCPKCDPSKEFTTKSNLKRHLENKNIHNTPYERRRDQKRWQGHEKKQVSRDETTLRMRKWRSSNPEKNRFNDMRCRVYKLARIRYGEQYSASKEEFIASEIERRKQLMIIRNSRRVDWTNQASGGSGGDGSESTSTSPIPASSGFSMPSSDFTFGYETDSTGGQIVTSHHNSQQQIPAYGSNNASDSMAQDLSSNNKEEKTGPKDAQFLQDLIQNKLPPRRRSRSAMHSQMNNGGPASDAEAAIAAANALAFPTSSQSNAYGHNDSGLMPSPFGYSTATSNAQVPASPRQVRSFRKQRSTTENSGHHQQLRHHQFALGGTSTPNAFGGYSSVLGGSSYGGGSYVDSNEQLQMLEQKYYSGSISQTLGMTTKSSTGATGGKTQETLESVVEGMEIGQSLGPLDSATTTGASNNNIVGSGNTGAGLYGDRDTSAWFAATTTYNVTTTDDVSRGFPFPTIRDRKELARAAGIRLDIPSQQPLGGTGWINSLNNNNNHGGPGSDDRVGGSATSPESAAARSHHALSSPLSGSATGYGVHSSSQSPMLAPALTHSNNKHTKGSNLEVFSLQTGPMRLYGQGLGAPENSFFASADPSAAVTNYMAKEQPVGRRHSTHLSNLSM